MTSNLASGILLTLGVTFSSASVYAQSQAQLQKVFQADYNAQDAAFDRNDPVGATAFFASDFVLRDKTTGRITRNELPRQRILVGQIHHLAPKSAVAHSFIRHLTLNALKNKAVVLLQTRYVVQVVRPKTQKLMKIAISGFYQETWVKRPKGWRITEQQKISTQTSVI